MIDRRTVLRNILVTPILAALGAVGCTTGSSKLLTGCSVSVAKAKQIQLAQVLRNSIYTSEFRNCDFDPDVIRKMYE